jgi:hypothetical protein
MLAGGMFGVGLIEEWNACGGNVWRAIDRGRGILALGMFGVGNDLATGNERLEMSATLLRRAPG